MQSLQVFNRKYEGLFSKHYDTDGEDIEGQSGDADNSFNGRFGWIYSTTIIAEHERITLDEAWELPVIQSLNALVYLKAKNEHDNDLITRHGNKYK